MSSFVRLASLATVVDQHLRIKMGCGSSTETDGQPRQATLSAKAAAAPLMRGDATAAESPSPSPGLTAAATPRGLGEATWFAYGNDAAGQRPEEDPALMDDDVVDPLPPAEVTALTRDHLAKHTIESNKALIRARETGGPMQPGNPRDWQELMRMWVDGVNLPDDSGDAVGQS